MYSPKPSKKINWNGTLEVLICFLKAPPAKLAGLPYNVYDKGSVKAAVLMAIKALVMMAIKALLRLS